ncbi:MAG TPA: ABC transporter permease [Gemmatimonadaceae bacterium]
MSLSTFVRPAWRSLRRTPAFTVTASLTLVIGLGAAIAIFALVNGVLLRPLPYGNADRLVGAWHDLPGVSIHKANQMAGTYYTYKKLAHSIVDMGIYQGGAANVSDPAGGAAPRRVPAAFVSASVIPVLQVSPVVGRNFSDAEDRPNGPPAVVISEGLWRSQFGSDGRVVGRVLEINGRSRTIIGVMPQRFRFPSNDTQLWLPLQLDPNDAFPGGFNYDAVARLKPGVSVATAERDLASVLPRIVELYPNVAPGVSMKMLIDQGKPRPFLVPLKQDVTGGIAKTLWIVAGAAMLVLLVACANVTNLILVRTDARQRELAVREALGAGRMRVLVHLLAESTVITAISGAIGLGVAALAIHALVGSGGVEIPRLAEVGIDATTVAFAVVVSALVAVVCSVIPALRIGHTRLSQALREGGRSGMTGRAQQRVRGGLVAAQIAFALVALASSGLLVRTFERLTAVRPGFNPEHVATFWMSLPRARYTNDSSVVRFYTQLLDRVRAMPGVRSAAISSHLPLAENGMNQNPLYPVDDATYGSKIPPLQIYVTVDGEYFKTMGIPLLAGRTFDRLEVQRSDEAIVSQATAVQFWHDSTGRNAIGKRFRELPSGPLFTVVGVVGSTRDTALAAPPSQAAYFPQVPKSQGFDSQTRTTMALVVRTAGDPMSMTVPVQRAVHDLDATLPLFNVKSMSAAARASIAQLSFTIIVLGAAAVVTLVLGAIGLYGVMAYVVALRSRELGVRIALGATPASVVAMLTRQGVVITALGIVGGLLLFVPVARALRALLFGVAATDPLTLVTASALLVTVAALASWIPARRTTRLDPAEVLRAD